MGWRDRDWARLSEAGRRRLYGESVDTVRVLVWSVVALAVLAVAGFVSGVVGHVGRPSDEVAPIVYGGAVWKEGSLTCTAEGLDVARRAWVCTVWTIVQPGQAVAQATDPGGPCGIRHVDQDSRAWVCDRLDPPLQGTLPPPGQAPPSLTERVA
jgi:hypothetical protein